jgi:hypothetical protein
VLKQQNNLVTGSSKLTVLVVVITVSTVQKPEMALEGVSSPSPRAFEQSVDPLEWTPEGVSLQLSRSCMKCKKGDATAQEPSSRQSCQMFTVTDLS